MITCRFENGRKAALRHVVVDVILMKEEKILLVRRAMNLVEGGKYALIGGFVERGERIEEAAKREALEESGYTIESLKLFRVIDNPHRKGDDRENIAFVFLAKPGKKISEADRESTEVRWFSLSSLPPKEEIAFDHLEQIEQYLTERAT